METKNNIAQIERELLALLSNDRQQWIRIYRLMDQVEREQTYTTTSYTKWVQQLADKAKVHVSVLWSRKKAGAAYDEYNKRAAERGISVPVLENIENTVSPDNINLAVKIAGANTTVADDLIKKITDGQLHRTDLKKAWEQVKSERVAKGLTPTRKSRHSIEPDIANESDTISAAAVLFAIQHITAWLPNSDNPEIKHGFNACYKVLSELAVHTGSSRHARRIDAVVFENLSVTSHEHGLCIHGMEIKVNKDDLLTDHKMAEYTDYVDYFWIALPINLVEHAVDYAPDKWGILMFDKGTLTVYRKAEKLDAVMKQEILEEAVKRL